jgi:hypothetical protein
MAAGDVTPGARLELLENPETERVDINLNMPSKPGEYAGPVHGYTGDVPCLFFVLPVPEDHPDFGVRHITAPPHSINEETDGTVTVSPSILAVRGTSVDGPAPWHGYLEHGVWREV